MRLPNSALGAPLLLSLLLLILQIWGPEYAAAGPVGYSSSVGATQNKLTTATSLKTGKAVSSFPAYPKAADYASGACAGYAFCFASWNPPVVTEPDVMCPAGYDISSSNNIPICVQKQGVCPNGFDLSSKGECCQVKAQSNCYADWDNCVSDDLTNIGSICAGTNEYKNIVDNVQMVQVTAGSKWFDGTTDSAAYVDATGSYNGGTIAFDRTDGPNMYGGGTNMYGGGAVGQDDSTVQVIPSGNLVNLNGKLVHVGPVPPGSSQQPGGNSGVMVTVNSTGGAGSSQQQQQQQQQQALAALQQQAQQQGTYVPGQDMSNQAAALAALQQQAQQQGTYIPGQDMQTPPSPNQAAALAALQQQAQQQGTYIPGPSNTRLAAAAKLPSKPGSSSSSKLGSSSSSSSSKYVSSSGGSGSRLAPPKEGLLLMKMLLLLPKIVLGNVEIGVTSDIMAKKEVTASATNTKEDFLPTCFNKCCSSGADVQCVDVSHRVNYAKPAYLCPPGCKFIDESNKCLCSSGHFTPCQPTETVCSWGDQPICVGSKNFFGVEACKFVGLLQKDLPKVQCPYADAQAYSS